MLDLDLAISQVGALGFFQIVLVTFSAIFLFLVGANQASSIFEAMVPETRCRSPFEETVAKECPSGFQKFLVPEIDNALSKCERYNFTDVGSIIQKTFLPENSTSNCNMSVNHTGIDLVQCTEWEFDRDVMRNTVVSDFNLVCANQWASFFSQSALMFGVGVGSILSGYMSDSFMPESPRWLLEKNREDDAIVVLEMIARINRVNEKPHFEKLGDPDDSYKMIVDMQTPSEEKTLSLDEKTSLMSIFGMSHLRSATLKMFYNWFAVSCVYFGLTLNAAELDGDPFQNLCLNSVAEMFAVLLTIPLVHFCGRRATGCGSAIMAGTMCILVNLVSGGGILAVATVGKFAIAIAFCALFLHTNELYPTSIRNLGVGLCSAMARVGGIASPLIAMSGLISTDMPYIIFGILSIIAGVVVLTLPETNAAKLPQTLQEGDAFVASDRGIPRKIYQTFRQRRALLKVTEEPLLERGLQ